MKEYMKRMSRVGEWGGEMEMALLSKKYNCKFLLYLSDGKIITVSFLFSDINVD
jgi:hypothetical protein